MKAANIDDEFDRLKKAAKVTTDFELSKKLGLSKQSIAAARARGEIPPIWIKNSAKLFNVSTDWLFFGTGSMHQGEEVQPAPALNQPPQSQPEAAEQFQACPRCAKLEKELEAERAERREIAQENRQLWKDNATIREQLARMDEYQKMRKHMQEGTTDSYVA